MIKSNFLHINELLEVSAIYDDVANMNVKKIVILDNASYVHFEYDGNEFVHVWECNNGYIHEDNVCATNKEYMVDDKEFTHIIELINDIN